MKFLKEVAAAYSRGSLLEGALDFSYVRRDHSSHDSTESRTIGSEMNAIRHTN
jgi:hypothetical protein